MQVVLFCEKVERIGPKRYACTMRQEPYRQDVIDLELDAPIVPGRHYEIMIRGVFPDSGISNPDTPCVSDILGMTCRETLRAIDTKQYGEIKEKERGAR